MILLGILFAMLILAFLAIIVYRGYLKDEAERRLEVETAVKEAISKVKKESE